MNKLVALCTAVVALVAVNWSIYQKEQVIEHGEVIFLKLAPVDPRSLMQGDYMDLEFEVSQQVRKALFEQDELDVYLDAYDGVIRAQLDQNRVASFVAIEQQQGASANDVYLPFRLRNGVIKFASNAFFFEEGKADKFESAQYGEFRLGENGELLLIGLRDAELKILD